MPPGRARGRRAARRQRRGAAPWPAAAARRFDQVVLATHGDTALGLLDDPTPEEKRLLGASATAATSSPCTPTPVLMPKRRRAWCSWNHIGMRAAPGEGAVTYWMNRLQSLEGAPDLFVTLNPNKEIAAEELIKTEVYEHPLFDAGAVAGPAGVLGHPGGAADLVLRLVPGPRLPRGRAAVGPGRGRATGRRAPALDGRRARATASTCGPSRTLMRATPGPFGVMRAKQPGPLSGGRLPHPAEASAPFAALSHLHAAAGPGRAHGARSGPEAVLAPALQPHRLRSAPARRRLGDAAEGPGGGPPRRRRASPTAARCACWPCRASWAWGSIR